MAKRKSKLSSKKRASTHGGGKRQLPRACVVPADAAGSHPEASSHSESDESEPGPWSKAAKNWADASPRGPSRASTPPAGDPAPSNEEIEKRLRKARKLFREIEALMLKDVKTLDHQAQAKLLRYLDVRQDVEALEAQLAAMLQAPGDVAAPSQESSDGELGADDGVAAQYRDADDGSEVGSSSKGAGSSLSLASVVLATAHGASVFFEQPPPPTPPQPPPALRRSDVAAAGTSRENAYADRERWVRQLQGIYRRKLAQRRRRAQEAASQAAVDAFGFALERRSLRKYQLLLVEHVLQPRTFGQPNGRLRGDFLQLYGDSRMREPSRDGKQGKSKLASLPGDELGALSGLQSLLLRSDELRSLALEAIQLEKEGYLEDQQEHGYLGPMELLPGETYMALRTRTRVVCETRQATPAELARGAWPPSDPAGDGCQQRIHPGCARRHAAAAA